MPEIIWLYEGERPPEDRSWAMVAADRSGDRSGSMDPVEHDCGLTFYIAHPVSEVERSEAIARARAWAESHDVDTVYIEGD